MKFTAEFLTEKGNLRKATVDGLKAKALAKIDLPLEATPNGTYALVLGQDENGNEFYLTVALTIGSVDPFVKHEKKAKAPVVAEVPALPEDIFE